MLIAKTLCKAMGRATPTWMERLVNVLWWLKSRGDA
jgi:hypothetical protein